MVYPALNVCGFNDDLGTVVQ